MPKENYIIEMLGSLYPSMEIELEEFNFETDVTEEWHLYGKIKFTQGPVTFELSLTVYFSYILIHMYKPYRGIESCGPYIPAGEDPMRNGYINTDGDLTQRGYYELCRTMNEIMNIYRLAKRTPNAILELYTVAYLTALERYPELEFGEFYKLRLRSSIPLTRNLNKLVKTKYGFNTAWSLNLMSSFENLVVNHPAIFNGQMN